MSFEITKQGKLCDQLESLAYDWVLYSIEEQYGVESTDDLGVEQINEIEDYLEDEENYIEGYCRMVLRSMIDNHESREEIE